MCTFLHGKTSVSLAPSVNGGTLKINPSASLAKVVCQQSLACFIPLLLDKGAVNDKYLNHIILIRAFPRWELLPPPRVIKALDRKNTLKQVNSCTAGKIPCFVLGRRSFKGSWVLNWNTGVFLAVRREGSLCQCIPQDCSCMESQGRKEQEQEGLFERSRESSTEPQDHSWSLLWMWVLENSEETTVYAQHSRETSGPPCI